MSLVIRRISIISAVIILFGGTLTYQMLSGMRRPPVRVIGDFTYPIVDVMEVRSGSATFPILIQGQLVAYDKIDIFSEVTGTLKGSRRPFKVGNRFSKGDVLLELDDEEARLTLLSQKSTFLNTIASLMPDLKVDYPENYARWEQYLNNFKLEASPAPLPEAATEQEKRFIAARNLLNQYYAIKSAESRLNKYKITAPFSGVVTEAMVNPGAVVRAGQKVGELMNNSKYELQATVPLSELHNLSVGQTVTLTTTQVNGNWTGKVKRISDQVDLLSQSVAVFVEVGGQSLREGMYLSGYASSKPIENIIRIPKDLLMNQKAVYVMRDSQLARQEIELVRIHEDTALVRGLDEGTRILSRSFPSAYDGMVVRVKQ